MKALPQEELEVTKRYYQLVGQSAIRDVYDALVELITNCDDSYHRMGKERGRILVEVEHRYKGSSKVIIRDKAEGMTFDEMRQKVKKAGDLTSLKGDRGFMSRGLKECAALGKVTVESIKGDYYHKCEILQGMHKFVPYKSEKATTGIREQLSIQENGTAVTIENINVTVPRHDTLYEDLPWHYTLRDIVATHKVLLNDMKEKSKKPLIYKDPVSKLVIDKKFEVTGYQDATAHFLLYKADERLKDPIDKRFRRTGILIKGKRAIHEVTLFSSEFENDPYAEYYFGRLISPFIDNLCDEWDERRKKGENHPEKNPSLLIDPHRKEGIRRDHPFTKALFQTPMEFLRREIAKDKEKEREKRVQVENEETKKRLKKLAKAASRFIQEKVEEIEEFIPGSGETEKGEFAKTGIVIIPNFYTLEIGEMKTFGFRAKKMDGVSMEELVKVICDDEGIRIITPEFLLSPSRTTPGILTGSFKVEGVCETDAAILTATYDGLPTAEAGISVVKYKRVEIPNGLAFEKESYQVKEKKKKRLLLQAEYPSVVTEETPVEVSSDCEDIVIVRPQAVLRPISGKPYAEGYITIEGRRLGVKGKITASVHNYTAKVEVKVIQEKDKGIPFEFHIKDEDYGNFRAKWDRPNNPNLLLISARHESVKRYLGPKESNFEGVWLL
ncbi:MAG: hypothetical protein QME42_00575 [bacterium]|nr:hypothetical protein [bacterium]